MRIEIFNTTCKTFCETLNNDIIVGQILKKPYGRNVDGQYRL